MEDAASRTSYELTSPVMSTSADLAFTAPLRSLHAFIWISYDLFRTLSRFDLISPTRAPRDL